MSESTLKYATAYERALVERRYTLRTSIEHATDLPPLSHLSERLIGDVAIAAGVTAAIAPFLTVVDKSLVQRAAGSHTLLGSASASIAGMVANPIAYLRSPTFLWMWATYALTYSTANSLRTLTEYQQVKAASSGSTVDQRRRLMEQQKQASAATLFLGTTAVNSSASLVKDRAYARLFGAPSTLPVPRISYALWMSRDLTVIGSSFVLPEYVSRLLVDGGMKASSATAVAQIATPMAMQVVAGPLHYVGLDCHNRRLDGLTMGQRLAERGRFLAGGLVEVVAARMARILPGYGVAGVANKELRSAWREFLIRKHVQRHLSNDAATTDLVALIRAKKA